MVQDQYITLETILCSEIKKLKIKDSIKNTTSIKKAHEIIQNYEN